LACRAIHADQEADDDDDDDEQTGEERPTRRRIATTTSATSMNIVTFATPISIHPRLWAVALYPNTRTKDSFLHQKRGVLQLLTPAQKYLVPILGKHSGYDNTTYSKREECSKQNYKWSRMEDKEDNDNDNDKNNDKDDENNDKDGESWTTTTVDYELLPQCALYIELQLQSVTDAGDHTLAICQVVRTGVWDERKQTVRTPPKGDSIMTAAPLDSTTVLYSGQLREEGII
jgi:flavin reductase (DIM6/NTAB) family NADH-FMN oxidoreductase RutF